MKKANLFNKDVLCGYLIKDDEGFLFEYDDEYLNSAESSPISLTMPLSNKKFRSDVLLPFFDGLIPEGYYLDLTIKTFNLNPRDRFTF